MLEVVTGATEEGEGVEVVSGRGITASLAAFLLIGLERGKMLTGRRAVISDDLGGAPTGLLRSRRSNGRRRRVLKGPTLVSSFVTATVHVDAISNGSAGDGGRSQKRSPHSKGWKWVRKCKERMPAERVKRWSTIDLNKERQEKRKQQEGAKWQNSRANRKEKRNRKRRKRGKNEKEKEQLQKQNEPQYAVLPN